MDIIGLGKPRADSWHRKFRTRGEAGASKTFAMQERLFGSATKAISWHPSHRWKNFGVATWSD
jgi:hypothetical protein